MRAEETADTMTDVVEEEAMTTDAVVEEEATAGSVIEKCSNEVGNNATAQPCELLLSIQLCIPIH